MFQKIETILGPELLEPGTPVICYPVNGKEMLEINLSDAGNFILYEVIAVRSEVVGLQQVEDAGSNDDICKYIIKFFWELVEEGTWWARLSV